MILVLCYIILTLLGDVLAVILCLYWNEFGPLWVFLSSSPCISASFGALGSWPCA